MRLVGRDGHYIVDENPDGICIVGNIWIEGCRWWISTNPQQLIVWNINNSFARCLQLTNVVHLHHTQLELNQNELR